MTILTYFHNSIVSANKRVHRVNTGASFTACGLSADGEKQVAKDVNCKLCMNTKTYKCGGHDARS